MKTRVVACIISLFVCFTAGAFLFSAPKKTIHTIPEDAKIFIDGAEVGVGTYTVKFDRNTDYFQVRVEAPGYLVGRYRLLKDNPNKTVTYTLFEDEAIKNTVGYGSVYGDGEIDGMGLANQWFDVNCKEGLSEDVIWKRLINVSVNYFDELDVRDKAAGWIKSRWAYTDFPHQLVRTKLEVRMSFTEEDRVSYRVRLISEIRLKEDGPRAPFQKFNYLLKKYEGLVGDLQTTVGSNL